MAYDGPFDDERTCHSCGCYIKKELTVCPLCGGTGLSMRYVGNQILVVLVLAGVVVPILLLALLAASCPSGHLALHGSGC